MRTYRLFFQGTDGHIARAEAFLRHDATTIEMAEECHRARRRSYGERLAG